MNPTWGIRTRTTIAILMALALLAVVFMARSIIPNLMIAALMAIVAGPVIKMLNAKLRLHRGVAIGLTYLLFLTVAILLPVLFLAFMASLVGLGSGLTKSLETLEQWLVIILEQISTAHLLGELLEPTLTLLENLSLRDLMPSAEVIVSFFSSALGTTFSIAGAIFSFVFAVFLTFTYAVYMSADSANIAADFRNLIPVAYQFEITTLMQRIEQVWRSYVLGQLGVMVAIGLVTVIVAWLLGLPEALALGVIAGVLEIIPNLGPILATIPAVIIALFLGSTRFDINNLLFAVIVGLAYILIQKLEDMVLTPQIQGKAVEMRPLFVMISVIVGFQVGGFLGAIIAVPVVATGREIFRYLYAKVLQQVPYPQTTATQTGQVGGAN